MTNTVAYYDLKFSQILDKVISNSDKHTSLLRYILKRLVVKHHNLKKIAKDINRPDPLFGLKLKFEACHTYLRQAFHTFSQNYGLKMISEMKENDVDQFKSNLLLIIFWVFIINYNS